MHSYRIIPEEELIIQKLYGDITLPHLLDFCEKIIKEPHFSPLSSIVFDFRNARILMSLEELKAAAHSYKDTECFRGRKAMLVNRSVDTAKIMIFRDYVGDDQRICVYSTLDAASTFLQNDLSRYLDSDEPLREDFYIDSQFEKTISSDAHPLPSNPS